jgi:Mn-dependent DtxR family transcriptional regulator
MFIVRLYRPSFIASTINICYNKLRGKRRFLDCDTGGKRIKTAMPKSSAFHPPRGRRPAKRSKLSAHHRAGLTESAEDYLECISNLTQRNGFASVSDVAETLNLIRPSVSLMIKRLADLGYLKREPYRGFVLTPKGQSIAESIQRRHALLTELFVELGLDPHEFQGDIEGLEHHISDPALVRFQRLIAHLKKHPLSD